MSIDNLDLSIRNPKLDREFHITVPSSATVRDLKSALQTQYPGNPLPGSLTIIYAGRVLRTDDTILTNVLSNPPYILHLVVTDQAPLPPTPSSIVKEQPAPAAQDNNEDATEGNDGATTTNSSAVNNKEPEQFRDGALTSDDDDEEEGSWLPMRGETTQQATTTTTTAPIQQKGKEPEVEGGEPAATTSSAAATPRVPQQDDNDALLHSDPTFIAAYHAALQSLSGQTPSPSLTVSPSPSMWVPVQMYPPQQTSPMMMMMPPSPYQFPSPYTIPSDMVNGGQYYYPPNSPMMNMMMPQPPQQPGVDPSMQGMRRRRSASGAATGAATAAAAGEGGGPSSSSNQQRMVPLQAVIAMLTAAEREGPLPPSLSRILRLYRSTSASSSSQQQIQLIQPRLHRRGGIFQRPLIRQFNLRVNVNVRSLLQLMVLMVVVYQHCPPKRFAMLVVLGIALFLTGTDRVRHVLNRVAGIVQPPQNINNNPPELEQRVQPPQQQGDGIPPADQQQQELQNVVPETPEGQQRQEGGVAAAPAAAAQQEQQQPAPLELQDQGPGQLGILRELQALVVGFLTSLLPGFNVNPEDARAIAAAQEAFQDQAQDVRAM